MDKIAKFLRSLTKKEREVLASKTLPKIRALDLSGLDVKKVKSFELWRARHGRIRILFSKQGGQGIIFRIGFRKDAYKNL